MVRVRTSVWSSWDPFPSCGHQCFQARHSMPVHPLIKCLLEIHAEDQGATRGWQDSGYSKWSQNSESIMLSLTDVLFYHIPNMYFAIPGFGTKSIVDWLQGQLASNWGSAFPPLGQILSSQWHSAWGLCLSSLVSALFFFFFFPHSGEWEWKQCRQTVRLMRLTLGLFYPNPRFGGGIKK